MLGSGIMRWRGREFVLKMFFSILWTHMGYIRNYCCSLNWETNNMTKKHQLGLIYSPTVNKTLIKRTGKELTEMPHKKKCNRTWSKSFPFPHPTLVRGGLETFEEILMESEREGLSGCYFLKVPFFLLKRILLCVSFIVWVFPQARCTKKIHLSFLRVCSGKEKS